MSKKNKVSFLLCAGIIALAPFKSHAMFNGEKYEVFVNA